MHADSTLRRLPGKLLLLAWLVAGCTPGADTAHDPPDRTLGQCEAQFAQPDRARSCLVALGWDTVAALDRAYYLYHRLGTAAFAPAGTHPVSAAQAAALAGQPVVVVDSVVGIVLGNRRVPFEILLGSDSATAPLRLTVEWKRLARFPVLKWRYGVLAASGVVTTHNGQPAIVLDAEGQARVVPREVARASH